MTRKKLCLSFFFFHLIYLLLTSCFMWHIDCYHCTILSTFNMIVSPPCVFFIAFALSLSLSLHQSVYVRVVYFSESWQVSSLCHPLNQLSLRFIFLSPSSHLVSSLASLFLFSPLLHLAFSSRCFSCDFTHATSHRCAIVPVSFLMLLHESQCLFEFWFYSFLLLLACLSFLFFFYRWCFFSSPLFSSLMLLLLLLLLISLNSYSVLFVLAKRQTQRVMRHEESHFALWRVDRWIYSIPVNKVESEREQRKQVHSKNVSLLVECERVKILARRWLLWCKNNLAQALFAAFFFFFSLPPQTARLFPSPLSLSLSLSLPLAL